MHFAFSEDERMFQQAMREFLEKECTPDHVRTAVTEDRAVSRDRWRKLAELGVTGATASPEHGGLGIDERGVVLLLEESGRAVLPEPLVETTVGLALLRETRATEMERQVATGESVLSIGFDSTPIAHAGDADALIVVSGGEPFLVEQFSASRRPSLDPTRRIFDVEWNHADALPLGGRDAADLLFDRAALGTAAQLIGIASRCIELAAAYATHREQFGRPIGQFQAVKHLLANALVAVEFARPAVYRAADTVARGASERARDVSLAKALASEAAILACKVALQVHGAIGYTEENDLHLWLRRGFALASAWGDAARHRTRLGHEILG